MYNIERIPGTIKTFASLCYVCARIHSWFNFPEHTAVYKTVTTDYSITSRPDFILLPVSNYTKHINTKPKKAPSAVNTQWTLSNFTKLFCLHCWYLPICLQNVWLSDWPWPWYWFLFWKCLPSVLNTLPIRFSGRTRDYQVVRTLPSLLFEPPMSCCHIYLCGEPQHVSPNPYTRKKKLFCKPRPSFVNHWPAFSQSPKFYVTISIH